jgi:hypothetical protein
MNIIACALFFVCNKKTQFHIHLPGTAATAETTAWPRCKTAETVVFTPCIRDFD